MLYSPDSGISADSNGVASCGSSAISLPAGVSPGRSHDTAGLLREGADFRLDGHNLLRGAVRRKRTTSAMRSTAKWPSRPGQTPPYTPFACPPGVSEPGSAAARVHVHSSDAQESIGRTAGSVVLCPADGFANVESLAGGVRVTRSGQRQMLISFYRRSQHHPKGGLRDTSEDEEGPDEVAKHELSNSVVFNHR